MRKVGVEEWLIKVVEVVYRHAKRRSELVTFTVMLLTSE